MVVLGAALISLACVFLGYCGLQFHAELKRSRAQLTSHGLVKLWSAPASAIEIPNKGIAVQMPQPFRRIDPTISTTDLASMRLASSAKVVSMHGKSRVVAPPPAAGIEQSAVKKVAKG